MTRRYAGILVALFFTAGTAVFAGTEPGRGDIVFTPQNAGPVVFSHDYHIKARGVKCAACHFRTFTAGSDGFQMQKDKLTKREFCGHCHNGMKAFDLRSEKNCSRCHSK